MEVCILIKIPLAFALFVVKSPSVMGSIAIAKYIDRLTTNIVIVRSRRECFQKCINEDVCLSVNFLKRQGEADLCVMNGATINETYAVIKIPGQKIHDCDVGEWTYIEILNLYN